MPDFSRRSFLGASLAALAASRLAADDKPEKLKAVDVPPYEPSTLFLTWQRDPTTTMTIQWVGAAGETADTHVYWSADPAGIFQARATTAKPYPMTDLKVFRAELTGLTPGTDYWFRVGKHSPLYRFRTMPAKATDTIHFISGGDCGVNGHTIANNIQAARQDPMFAIIGGDLGYDNGKSVEISLAFLRNYSKHMVGRDGRLIPMIACIGNHEVDGGYGKPRSKAPFFYSLFDGLYPETGFATLDFGDYLSLVLLDTGHTTPIAGEQTAWLEKTLKARRDHPNVMVVNHVPAYPSFRKAEATPATTASPPRPAPAKAIASTGCRCSRNTACRWCSNITTTPSSAPSRLIDGLGHDNGVLYLGDGSWGRLRTPQAPEKLPYLAATSRDYHLSLHRLQGEERFHLALDEYGRVMDVCRTAQRKTRAVRAAG